ncbi:MAG: TonB-dependent receptor [Kordiimonadaceae bacterium]|nr:TonB-dependent receptor [Kordiimonadaceae bacterium]
MTISRKRLARRRWQVALLAATALALSWTAGLTAADPSRFVVFEIQPQKMQSALLAYSEQAGVQLILATDTQGMRSAHRLTGKLDFHEALILLIGDTNLNFEFTSENTVTITKKRVPQSARQTEVKAQKKNATINSVPSAPIEEIVSIGTRAKGRTAISTPVPVDVVTARAMADTGHTEVGRMLQVLAPSFNFSSSSISDGTDALRPATLRGLGPDQTLVLVNGKRRHTGAIVHVNTSVGRGTAGVDMNAVPAAALASIEVLRDGAAAQYGSDAIAGVINLKLKENADGGEANISYGETYEGDGATFTANANMGFELGDGGFLTLTAEYRDRGATNRAGLSGAVQYPLLANGGGCDAIDNTGCDPREFTFDRQNFRIGDGKSEQKTFVVNAQVPLSDRANFYAFGTYSDRTSETGGFYRRANEYERTVTEIYPEGFLPLINTNIEDFSLTNGIDWQLDNGLSLDFSVSHGANTFQFIISNSANASLGVVSPTRADAGTLGISQTIFNVDAVMPFELGGRDASFAIGGEYRRENYTIKAGEPASYIDGGAFNSNCPGCDVSPLAYASGFQVFRGFTPLSEVDESRNNIAAYVDIETQLSDQWLVATAVRIEDYSDFGGKLTSKLSSRYELGKGLALRGSVSTGFRAPSMQQKFFNSISTQFVEIDGVFVAQERGTFRNDSSVARLVGIPALKEETSVGLSAGFVVTQGALTLTVDYYHIQIDDRIGLSGSIDFSQPGFEAIDGKASSGQFFVNYADTKTNGMDFVATYDVALPGDQKLKLSASGNWTATEVVAGSILDSVGGVHVGQLFTPQDISITEEWQPKTRANFTANYANGNWAVVTRVGHYGAYTVCEGSCDTASNVQTFSAKWLADIQLNYRFPESGLKVTVGANNLFDTTPDLNLIGQDRAGSIAGIVDSIGVFQYSRRSAPFGFNGGYWYVRATYSY